MSGQLDQVVDLTAQARTAAGERQQATTQGLREALARMSDSGDLVDEARFAQELALVSVKLDVTEELDRMEAHITATRTLLGESGQIGRKLDFLIQEFNREANTLCSKSQNAVLTRLGLDLKVAIDQMREQVQNVE